LDSLIPAHRRSIFRRVNPALRRFDHADHPAGGPRGGAKERDEANRLPGDGRYDGSRVAVGEPTELIERRRTETGASRREEGDRKPGSSRPAHDVGPVAVSAGPLVIAEVADAVGAERMVQTEAVPGLMREESQGSSPCDGDAVVAAGRVIV